LSQSANVIPLEKFIVATFRMQDEDPRGQSLFRSIVKPWHIKQLTWPEFLAYLMRWAMPSLAAILSEDAVDESITDADGNPLTDPSTGQAITKSAAQVVLGALLDFRNSSGLVLPHGTELVPIEATGEGQVFDTAFSVLNKQIRKGILLQELATADAEHQTKSSTGEQMNVVELLVWSIKMWVAEDLVRRQICYPQVEYNFGEADARDLTPKASLGDYDRKDWADDSKAVVALISATVLDENGNRVNALTPSQIQSLLTQIGIQPPTEEEIAAIRAKSDERQKQQQQNQPPGNDQQSGNQSGTNDQMQRAA
jgi:phage gp29-like protein